MLNSLNSIPRAFVRSHIHQIVSRINPHAQDWARRYLDVHSFGRVTQANKDAAVGQLEDVCACIRNAMQREARGEQPFEDKSLRLAYVPFTGFCQSLSGEGLADECAESERDYMRESLEHDYPDCPDAVEAGLDAFEADTSACYDAIGRKWAELYAAGLADELDMPELESAIVFDGIDYSRDYYQSDDEIRSRIPLHVLRAVLRTVASDPARLKAFADLVRVRMTPRSGWAPFFSTEWTEWGARAHLERLADRTFARIAARSDRI